MLRCPSWLPFVKIIHSLGTTLEFCLFVTSKFANLRTLNQTKVISTLDRYTIMEGDSLRAEGSDRKDGSLSCEKVEPPLARGCRTVNTNKVFAQLVLHFHHLVTTTQLTNLTLPTSN